MLNQYKLCENYNLCHSSKHSFSPSSVNTFEKKTSITDPRTVLGNPLYCRAYLFTSVADCKRPFRSAWKTETAIGLVLALQTDFVNGCRRKSVEVEWTTSNRIKTVTLRIVNIKAGPLVPNHLAEAVVPEPTTDKIERRDDLPTATTKIEAETITAHEAAASKADAIAYERVWTT